MGRAGRTQPPPAFADSGQPGPKVMPDMLMPVASMFFQPWSNTYSFQLLSAYFFADADFNILFPVSVVRLENCIKNKLKYLPTRAFFS